MLPLALRAYVKREGRLPHGLPAAAAGNPTDAP